LLRQNTGWSKGTSPRGKGQVPGSWKEHIGNEIPPDKRDDQGTDHEHFIAEQRTSRQPTADALVPPGANPALQRDAETAAQLAPVVATTPGTADAASAPAGDPAPPDAAPAAKVGAVPGLSAEAQKYVRLLGPALAVEGEDAARYNRLLVNVAEILRPLDVVNWIPLKDFIDNQWELICCGRRKPISSLIPGCRPRSTQRNSPRRPERSALLAPARRHRTLRTPGVVATQVRDPGL
jgi:hypothetical protein